MKIVEKASVMLADVRAWLRRIFHGGPRSKPSQSTLEPQTTHPERPVQPAALSLEPESAPTPAVEPAPLANALQPKPQAPHAVATDDLIVASAPAPSRTIVARRTRTQERPDAETFSQLLDNLDSTFSSMSIPSIRGNWLPTKDVAALHKLGIFVPTPWLLEVMPNPAMPIGTPLPSIASCLMISSRYDDTTSDMINPRFAFALKEPRLPASAEQMPGTAYRFGLAYPMPGANLRPSKDKAQHMWWVWGYAVVAPDGRIVFPSELRPVTNQIRHRRCNHLRGDQSSRSFTFQTRQWVRPSITKMHEDDTDHGEFENFIACTMRQLLLWWNDRGSQWSVGVRKDGKRITFNVANNHTAAFFADREKVVAVNGTAKKIIHYVRQHTRVNGSTVKEHVRGLSDFEWRGYRCIVTAPKLNGNVVTNADLTPIMAPRDAPPGKFLETLEIAESLALAEDRLSLRGFAR